MARRTFPSGPIELDLDRYELRRAGIRINLERIPMELLILLAQSGGRLLSREEIIEHLWGKNPWLDGERNLNTAIGKLRRALGDNADQPRFIETVVGKGYRFIVSDQWANAAGPSIPNGKGSHSTDVHFELVHAPVTGGAMQSAPEPVLAVAAQPAPTAAFDHVSVASVSEVPLPPSISVRRFRRRSGILVAFAAVALTLLVFLTRPHTTPAIPHYKLITSDDRAKEFMLGEFPVPILTDSVRLYFPMLDGTGNLTIGQVFNLGGQSGAVSTSLRSPLALGISPDGSSLLVASPAALPQAPLWIQPIPAGQPRRLGHVEARSASWSPDGRRIAYTTTTGLFTVRADGTDVHRLVSIDPNTAKQVYWPRWAPDASRLRYSLYDPKTGYSSLWQVNADATGMRAVLPGWSSASNECCGSWTSDGRFFVFAAIKNGRSDTWAMSEALNPFERYSHQPFQLTAGPMSFSSPLPARDGNIFVAGTETRGELARWDSQAKTMVPWLGGASAVGVSSSRDGKWVTYTSFPDRTLWRSRVDGSAKLQLTTPPTEVYLPRWSPDDRQIAFYARIPGAPFQIYFVSADGGTIHGALPSGRQQIDPTWSKDGRQIMFESDPWQERGSERRTQIEILDLQSGKATVLPGSAGLVSPRWSPDGGFVAAMPANSSGLMLFDFRTQTWTRLVSANIGYPNWSHDGKYIYFDWFYSPGGVRRIRMADHEIQNVISRHTGDRLWTADDWTGLTSDDSVLLLRNLSIQEIYAIRW